jgi:hypothetical protein
MESFGPVVGEIAIFSHLPKTQSAKKGAKWYKIGTLKTSIYKSTIT